MEKFVVQSVVIVHRLYRPKGQTPTLRFLGEPGRFAFTAPSAVECARMPIGYPIMWITSRGLGFTFWFWPVSRIFSIGNEIGQPQFITIRAFSQPDFAFILRQRLHPHGKFGHVFAAVSGCLSAFRDIDPDLLNDILLFAHTPNRMFHTVARLYQI